MLGRSQHLPWSVSKKTLFHQLENSQYGLDSSRGGTLQGLNNGDPSVKVVCSDITNDQLGISGETGHGGANLCIY